MGQGVLLKVVKNISTFQVDHESNNTVINPNPGGLVANMTSKTLNWCVKVYHSQKIEKNFKSSITVLCLIL
jgi:hypothetical protein